MYYAILWLDNFRKIIWKENCTVSYYASLVNPETGETVSAKSIYSNKSLPVEMSIVIDDKYSPLLMMTLGGNGVWELNNMSAETSLNVLQQVISDLQWHYMNRVKQSRKDNLELRACDLLGDMITMAKNSPNTIWVVD